jgi:hypothetical protein
MWRVVLARSRGFWDGGVFLRKGMFFGAQRSGGAKADGSADVVLAE